MKQLPFSGGEGEEEEEERVGEREEKKLPPLFFLLEIEINEKESYLYPDCFTS